jgi:hypothetical protein
MLMISAMVITTVADDDAPVVRGNPPAQGANIVVTPDFVELFDTVDDVATNHRPGILVTIGFHSAPDMPEILVGANGLIAFGASLHYDSDLIRRGPGVPRLATGFVWDGVALTATSGAGVQQVSLPVNEARFGGPDMDTDGRRSPDGVMPIVSVAFEIADAAAVGTAHAGLAERLGLAISDLSINLCDMVDEVDDPDTELPAANFPVFVEDPEPPPPPPPGALSFVWTREAHRPMAGGMESFRLTVTEAAGQHVPGPLYLAIRQTHAGFTSTGAVNNVSFVTYQEVALGTPVNIIHATGVDVTVTLVNEDLAGLVYADVTPTNALDSWAAPTSN